MNKEKLEVLQKEYKKLQHRLYQIKYREKIKKDPAKYAEFRVKENERLKKYRPVKGIENNKSVEAIDSEIKRLKAYQSHRKRYLKIKADPERYAKIIERNKEYYRRKKAEKAAVKAADEVVNQPVLDVNEPCWNWRPFATAGRIVSQEKVIGIANNVNDKNIVVGEGQIGTVNEEGNIENVNLYNASADNKEPEDEEVAKAYDNLINTIREYVPNFIHTSEIYRALDRYINAYSMFLDSNKKVLLSEIIKLFNK